MIYLSYHKIVKTWPESLQSKNMKIRRCHPPTRDRRQKHVPFHSLCRFLAVSVSARAQLLVDSPLVRLRCCRFDKSPTTGRFTVDAYWPIHWLCRFAVLSFHRLCRFALSTNASPRLTLLFVSLVFLACVLHRFLFSTKTPLRPFRRFVSGRFTVSPISPFRFVRFSRFTSLAVSLRFTLAHRWRTSCLVSGPTEGHRTGTAWLHQGGHTSALRVLTFAFRICLEAFLLVAWTYLNHLTTNS